MTTSAPELPGPSELYEEMRRLARNFMRRERFGHTLQATALAHEAYLRLQGRGDITERADLLPAAAQTMRRILVDHARRKQSQKRGGGVTPVALVDVPDGARDASELVALDEAMEKLAALDERKCRIVELLFFAALNVPEAAALLRLSTTTVEDEWYLARAWLRVQLDGR